MFFVGPVARRLRAVSGMKQVSQRIRIYAREGTYRCRRGNPHSVRKCTAVRRQINLDIEALELGESLAPLGFILTDRPA